jgi:hypothetical protein
MTTTNFLGIPIDGDITRGANRTEQRPLSDLEPALRAVLDDPLIVEFGWRQYTPYFNDGDPCVFSPGELWFRTTQDEDTSELELWYHPTLGAQRWSAATGTHLDVERSPDVVATRTRCEKLSALINSDAFDEVLLDAFGDHARVTVRRTGISVDFYEHG